MTTTTDTPPAILTESWADIAERLHAAETAELEEVADEATMAEKDAAALEERLRDGGDVSPGEIEAAEALGRHARIRLEAVRRKHARLREEARKLHRRRAHDALAAFAERGTAERAEAVKGIQEAIAKLAAAVPAWNVELARLRAEAAGVNTPEDGDDLRLGTSVLRSNHGQITVDGKLLKPLTVGGLLYTGVLHGLGGDWARTNEVLAEAAA